MIADSTEAIRALSGDQISREEAALLWQEIRNRKEAGGKTAAEVGETLGYQIETSDLQALDNDLLTPVAGGLAARNIEKIDLGNLFPDEIGGDFNYGFLENLLNVKR